VTGELQVLQSIRPYSQLFPECATDSLFGFAKRVVSTREDLRRIPFLPEQSHSNATRMPETPQPSQPQRSPQRFRTTHWSLVVAASGASREALEELCEAYWSPLFWHLRRLGYEVAEAEDLTQAFFARLLDKQLLGAVEQGRGGFRTFLITALRRFVVNEWKYETAAKRGGGTRHVTIHADDESAGVAAEVAHDLTPDRLFERQWAIIVLQRAFQELETEQFELGHQAQFESLAPCLTRDAESPGYEELAKHLQSTPAALRMAVGRLRKRLAELVRAEIRTTVDRDTDIEDELLCLFQALQP
jgi:RNA polymerase sigma factor (sigma-70 family)